MNKQSVLHPDDLYELEDYAPASPTSEELARTLRALVDLLP
jgi:hypothetical protein